MSEHLLSGIYNFSSQCILGEGINLRFGIQSVCYLRVSPCHETCYAMLRVTHSFSEPQVARVLYGEK